MPSRFENGLLDVSFVQSLVRMLAKPEDFDEQLKSINERVKSAAPDGPIGPLATVTVCEMLRQCAPAWCNPDSKKTSAGIVRGEAAEAPTLTRDCTPDNVAFTYSGLTALKMDGDTLASFPDAFKEGMAARADRLHDTGPSAPEAWEGELGLPSVHGYFTGSFDLSEGEAPKEVVLESDAPRCRSVQQSRKRTRTDTSFWISYAVPCLRHGDLAYRTGPVPI